LHLLGLGVRAAAEDLPAIDAERTFAPQALLGLIETLNELPAAAAWLGRIGHCGILAFRPCRTVRIPAVDAVHHAHRYGRLQGR